MYFKDKKSTNIDDELNDKKTKNFHINLNNKNILLLIIGAIFLVFGIIFLITLNTKNKVNYFLELNGNELLTIYKDNEYIEPSYIARDNKGNDLTKEVIIDSNLDTSKKGTYQIVYTVTNSTGVTTSAKRTVIVMDANISLSLDNEGYTNKEER